MAKSKPNEFQERYQQEQLTEVREVGTRAIPVERIVGSVNRWQEFDSRFHSRKVKPRLLSIMQALQRGVILPPIEVYKVQDDFYVIDGNHRVAAAKQFGQEFIDAQILEILPPADSPAHLLWREKSNFELLTGISLHFTVNGSYQKVLHYLKKYHQELNSQPELSLKEAAQHWQREVYRPISAALQESGLMAAFPGYQADDLFLYLLHHQLTKTALQGRKVEIREAVAAFREINPCQMESAIQKIFHGFVFKKACAAPCLNCARRCPEGLICFNDGRIEIAETCTGCGSCTQDCPKENLTAYENAATALQPTAQM